MGPQKEQQLRSKVNLEVMAMKRLFTLPKSSKIEAHHKIVFVLYPGNLSWGLIPPFFRRANVPHCYDLDMKIQAMEDFR